MKKLFILLLPLFIFGHLAAVPANPRPVTKTQPDGTEITVRIKGDERVHWMESLDGYTLMYNNKQEVVFAVHDNRGDLTPSEILYKGEDLSKYLISERERIQEIPVKLRYSKEQLNTMWRIKGIAGNVDAANVGAADKAQAAVTGTKKLLVILAQFSDKTFTHSIDKFQDLMNQVGYTANGNTGSVRDFYRENSYGKMDMEVTVVGPVTCDETTSYYGSKESRWPDWAKEVAENADNDVDYSQYAENGKVPTFHIIFAGYGDESIDDGKQIWSHQHYFEDVLTADGVTVGHRYSCSPELEGYRGSVMTYAGVICHELCHAFGAPDYYDTDYDGGTKYYQGTGGYDLMADGSWNNEGATPAHINMWQKILFGWVEAIELVDSSSVSDMPASADSAVAYWIKVNTSGERYVLENRQKKKFDAYIPGHGLIIWHIHKNALGGDCDNSTHPQEVYPVDASVATAIPTSTVSSYGGKYDSYDECYYWDGGCTFPGTSGNTEFGGTTTPRMFSWNGASGTAVTGKDITNITEDLVNKTVSFDFMGGKKIEDAASETLIVAGRRVKVYPNPTTGRFSVSVDGGAGIVGSVFAEIFTPSGVCVEKKQIASCAEFELQSKGLYMLRATSADGHVSTQKIIVK